MLLLGVSSSPLIPPSNPHAFLPSPLLFPSNPPLPYPLSLSYYCISALYPSPLPAFFFKTNFSSFSVSLLVYAMLYFWLSLSFVSISLSFASLPLSFSQIWAFMHLSYSYAIFCHVSSTTNHCYSNWVFLVSGALGF